MVFMFLISLSRASFEPPEVGLEVGKSLGGSESSTLPAALVDAVGKGDVGD